MLGGSQQRRQVETENEPIPVTDGGTDTSELPVVGIAVLSILYFLMNLLVTLALVGLGGMAGGMGFGDAAAVAGIAAIVSLVLTLGFIVAPIGLYVGASWAWTVMAGVWTLNLIWSLLLPLTSGSIPGIIGMMLILVNVAILGWIYKNRGHQLPIDAGQPTV